MKLNLLLAFVVTMFISVTTSYAAFPVQRTQTTTSVLTVAKSEKATVVAAVGSDSTDKTVAAVLAFFLGVLGIHRFYMGDTGIGIAQLLMTCTVILMPISWIWSFIDFIRILLGDLS